MSSMEFNRIAGAILLTLIVIKVADIAGGAMGHVAPLAKPAFAPTGLAQASAEAKPDGTKADAKADAKPVAIGPLLAAASADKGKSVANKCTTCHDLSKGGKAKLGPALWGIVGAKIADGSFRFSDALKKLQGKWDFAALNAFLADPKGYAPGTKMVFAGIKNDGDRAALILYLRSLADNPVPLP
ncbi:MAG: c-type cytochrome [Alphaproteobacteria bacterium]|nr:c-type cytochrome [Alphaproteobacteria bacterium]